jgi:adenylosuccinate lyase
MRAFHEQKDFRTLLLADPDLVEVLGQDEIDRAFDLNDQLRNVDAIFDRVFNRTAELAGAGAAGERERS